MNKLDSNWISKLAIIPLQIQQKHDIDVFNYFTSNHNSTIIPSFFKSLFKSICKIYTNYFRNLTTNSECVIEQQRDRFIDWKFEQIVGIDTFVVVVVLSTVLFLFYIFDKDN